MLRNALPRKPRSLSRSLEYWTGFRVIRHFVVDSTLAAKGRYMGFFSKLFGARESSVRTTVDRPFRISSPNIGFLNLQGAQGAALAEADQIALSPLFIASNASTDIVPKCAVLFIYCTLDANGKIVGSSFGVRQLIKEAGAYVAVVASGNQPEAYIKAMGNPNDWHANIALVIDRKADKFAIFFRRLFEAMFNEQSMLTVWVELAPQIPGYDHPDAPNTIMAAEAGHVTFGR